MVNPIVSVEVSQVVAPNPVSLLQKGAFVSVGGTTTAAGTLTLLTSEEDLTDILGAPAAITTAAWLANVVTITTAAPHGLPTGAVLPATIAGFTPSAYNGAFDITVTGASTFTYPLTGDPGADSVQGTYVLDAVAELRAMGNTFFAQGSSVSVYVLELGAQAADDAVADLDAYITANPGVIYSWLVPRAFADESDFIAVCGTYNATTALTYFYVTADLSNYTDFSDDMKCVFSEVEAPATPATEFSVAAAFYRTLSANPSGSIKVPPLFAAYQLGTTAYPAAGNGATLTALKAANTNYIGSGAEGGVTTNILRQGVFRDGNDFLYWYAVDWMIVNSRLDLANEIINGSNQTRNPIYYNQQGINRLQARAQATANRGVTFGLLFGDPVVEAIGFVSYVTNNPSDYPEGIYNGLSITFSPNHGFKSITYSMTVTDFPVPATANT